MKVATHTGATAFSGTIEQNTDRLYFVGTYNAAIAELEGTKITLSQATKRKTGTMFPELTMKQLGDIAGTLGGLKYVDVANKKMHISIPLSMKEGVEYDLDGGALSYQVSGATAAASLDIYAMPGLAKSPEYIEVIPVGSALAGAVKSIPVYDVNMVFVDPAKLTRLSIVYKGGKTNEFTAEELKELARYENPVQTVTALGVVTPGFEFLVGVNVIDASEIQLNMSTADNILLVRHVKAV